MNKHTKKLFFTKNSSGFTLVELLIVIVIIGILAGVVITIMNPIQQQRRAQDGNTKAQIDKMALSAKSLFASSPRATEKSPTLLEFGEGFASSTDIRANCANPDTNITASCLFTMDGFTFPSECAPNGYNDTGSSPCNYFYWRTTDAFLVAARGFASPPSLFVYYYREELASGNVEEGFFSCPVNYDITTMGPPLWCDRL